ncbi:MAG: cupin domain-containing protein [bacterium]
MVYDDAIDLLFGYASGVLEELEKERAARLLAGEPLARELFNDIERVFRALPFTIQQHESPASLQQSILKIIAREQVSVSASEPAEAAAQRRPPAVAESFTAHSDEGAWEETGLPGVSFKKLFVDRERAYITLLLRMRAGAFYPSHQHGGYEECLVLEGEVRSAEVQLRAGDYQRMTGGSLHHALQTDKGCLLLIIASQENEIVG